MGKRKVYTEGEIAEAMVMPGEGHVFGRVEGLHGSGWVSVLCTDGARRMCRVRGKLRRRVWVRVGDVVLVEPWQFDRVKGEILFRYTGGQVQYLVSKGLIPKEFTASAVLT